MKAIPEEIAALVSDLEVFLCDGLKGENLSKKAKEKREVFLKRLKEVKLGFPHDFKDKSEEDFEEERESDSNNDTGSLQSERTDKDEETCEAKRSNPLSQRQWDSAWQQIGAKTEPIDCFNAKKFTNFRHFEGAQQSPPVAAQDLTSVFKSGYLEKRRKDHSFFGTEWQKRWCALSQQTFYYYGSDKDKQQKGEFAIDGYSVNMNNTLRKDNKKDCCFEISAPDKRVYQFCASSAKEAEEWVKDIDFVLKAMSGVIPEDEDEYNDVEHVADEKAEEPNEDDIYEELPEEEDPIPAKPPPKIEPLKKPPPPAAAPVVDKSTDYKNFYQCLWDCLGDHPDELSFKRGDAIYILSKEYNLFGWWVGEKNGAIGIVPKDYLMELYVT